MRITRYQKRLSLLLGITLCSVQLTMAQTSIKVYADPESTPGIKASKFIDHIDFIPLEAGKAAKYSSANNYKIAGDQLVVHDDQDNRLIFFDKKTGKYLYSFKNDKKRYKIVHFQYAPDRDALLVTSLNKHYTISSKKAGQLIGRWQNRDIAKFVQMQWIDLKDHYRTKKMRVPSIALNNDFTYLNGAYIFRNYQTNHYSKDTVLYRLVQYDAQQHIKHQYFPFLNLKGLWSDYYKYKLPLVENSTTSDSSMLFQVDFDPTIYELKPDTLIEKYRFVFPMKNSLPADYSSLSFRNDIDFQKYKDKNSTAFSEAYQIIEHGKVLIFSLNALSRKHSAFLLLNNILYDYTKVITDSSIHNLPPTILRGICGQDKNYIYAIFNPMSILRQKEILLKDATISQAFKDYLTQFQPEMADSYNDILLRIKIK